MRKMPLNVLVMVIYFENSRLQTPSPDRLQRSPFPHGGEGCRVVVFVLGAGPGSITPIAPEVERWSRLAARAARFVPGPRFACGKKDRQYLASNFFRLLGRLSYRLAVGERDAVLQVSEVANVLAQGNVQLLQPLGLPLGRPA